VKVLITGSAGTIGKVLVRALAHDVTEFDLPARDARSLEQLTDAANGHDVVVHLAWNTAAEHSGNDNIDFDNARMAFNVYRAAERTGVPRVIVASSVHADVPRARRGRSLVASEGSTPDSPYGASKLFVEALGRYFATRGLEVVVVRFGWVSEADDAVALATGVHTWWLSQSDCIQLVDACVTASTVPNGYTAFYGVSDNPDRIHDTTNPFGWAPLTRAQPRGRMPWWRRVAPRSRP